MLVEDIAFHVGEGAAQQPSFCVQQHDLCLRLALNVAEHSGQGGLDQHAADDAITQHHGPGGGQRRHG